MLGHEEAVALRSDGAVLLAKRGRGSSVSFTDAEMDVMWQAAVFTHNHPAGGSFSPQDVAMACTLEVGEIRVVTAEWTHLLRPGAAGWDRAYWDECVDDMFQRAFHSRTDEFQAAIA